MKKIRTEFQVNKESKTVLRLTAYVINMQKQATQVKKEGK